MSFISLPALAGRKERFKNTQATLFKFFIPMDQETNESQQAISETLEAKQARLEENYRRSPMVLINRSSLTEWLEQAYAEYDKCWRHGDKINALVWDGFIRAYHRCLDAEVTKR
ncbi:MAG: hypothetical protein CMO47_14685 [Verrucomicrobiales bacterium]|nr:hypothetical protein [Verrucomicrobiales bacterium]